MARFSQYARNVGVMVGQSLVQRVIGLLTTLVLARMLGAASFGAYSVVANTASSAFGLVRLGVDASIHVSVAEPHANDAGRAQKREIVAAGFLLLALSGAIGALACLALADWLAVRVFGVPDLAVWIRVAGGLVLLHSVAQFCYVTMAGLQQFAAYARIMMGSAVINSIAVTTGVFLAGLNGAVAGLIGAQGVTTVWLLWALKAGLRTEALQPALRNFTLRAAQLVRNGFPFYAAGLVSIPVIYYLQGLVAQSGRLEALGHLRAISALAMIVSFVPTSASGPMISMLVRTRGERESAFPDSIMRNVKMALVFTLMMVTAIMIVLPWLMPVLFGSEYVAAVGAAGFALIAAAFTAVGGVIGTALFSARRVDLVFLLTLVQMGIFCLAGIVLIPAYGLIGYVLAELLGCSVLLVVAYWRSFHWFRRNGVQTAWVWKLLLPIALLMTYCAIQVAHDGTPSLVAGTTGAAGLAVACVWGYRAILDSAERNAIRRLMSSRNEDRAPER